jgi:hypothetical protein
MRVTTHDEFVDILETENLTPEECYGAWYVNMYDVQGFDEVYFIKLSNDIYKFVFEHNSHESQTIEDMVRWIRETIIVPAIAEDSMNDTCFRIQKRVGQSCGGNAGRYFSDDAKYMDIISEYILLEIEDLEPLVEDLGMSYLYGQLDISLGEIETYSLDINLLADESALVAVLNKTPIHLSYYSEIKEYTSIIPNLIVTEDNAFIIRKGFKKLWEAHSSSMSWSSIQEFCEEHHLGESFTKWVIRTWLDNMRANIWLNKRG